MLLTWQSISAGVTIERLISYRTHTQAQAADKTDGTGNGAITLLKPFVSASYLSHIHESTHLPKQSAGAGRRTQMEMSEERGLYKSTANIGSEIPVRRQRWQCLKPFGLAFVVGKISKLRAHLQHNARVSPIFHRIRHFYLSLSLLISLKLKIAS